MDAEKYLTLKESLTVESKLAKNKVLPKPLQRGVLESNGLRTNGRKYRLRKQLVVCNI